MGKEGKESRGEWRKKGEEGDEKRVGLWEEVV